MEEGVKQYYRQNGIPPGVPTQKGSNADPYQTGVALPNVPLGNYDVPNGWPTNVRFNEPGDVPGPPVQFESDDLGDPGAGYGFESDHTYEGDWFFFHTDHLGSTSYLTDTAGNVSQFVCYTPYGEAIVDEHLTTYENPFKFSGKELDDITGLYDHGARSRNPISTLWYGVDPLWEKYPEFGAYVYCAGNPVKLVDPDGRSARVHKDIKHKIITVNANIIMTGNANADIAARVSNRIESLWNAAKGVVTIDNVEYKVVFKLKGFYHCKFVFEIAKFFNNDPADNYIRVSDYVDDNPPNNGCSWMRLNGHEGHFQLNQITQEGETTSAHEFGHGLGLEHPDNNQKGKGQPRIMCPRGTLVDDEYSYGPGKTINPLKRKVSQEDIDALKLDKLHFDKDGNSNLGK